MSEFESSISEPGPAPTQKDLVSVLFVGAKREIATRLEPHIAHDPEVIDEIIRSYKRHLGEDFVPLVDLELF